ncbi:hypothetical protein JCM5353_001642 [Sporobolomyces roseus]
MEKVVSQLYPSRKDVPIGMQQALRYFGERESDKEKLGFQPQLKLPTARYAVSSSSASSYHRSAQSHISTPPSTSSRSQLLASSSDSPPLEQIQQPDVTTTSTSSSFNMAQREEGVEDGTGMKESEAERRKVDVETQSQAGSVEGLQTGETDIEEGLKAASSATDASTDEEDTGSSGSSESEEKEVEIQYASPDFEDSRLSNFRAAYEDDDDPYEEDPDMPIPHDYHFHFPAAHSENPETPPHSPSPLDSPLSSPPPPQSSPHLNQHPDRPSSSPPSPSPPPTSSSPLFSKKLASRTSYRPPNRPNPNLRPPGARDLTAEERLSLKLRSNNLKHGSTQGAYESEAKTWREEGKREVLSLHRVDRLAQELSGVEEKKIDICPNGCMAYAGPVNSKKEYCDQRRRKTAIDENGVPLKTSEGNVIKIWEVCKLSRYKSADKKEAALSISAFSLVSRMRVLFQDRNLAHGLRSLGLRRRAAKKAREKEGGNGRPDSYDDFGDGDHIYKLSQEVPELFEDDRTTFFNISTDGAILKLGSDGDFWSIEATIANLPVEMGRYQKEFQWTYLIIPAKLPPVDLESFFYPLVEELDAAAMGYYFWDAYSQEWFLWRGAWLLLLADQMGMVKLSGMNGSRGHLPCWFCHIIRCHASNSKRGTYVPLRTLRKHMPDETELNHEREDTYDGYNLPMRSTESLRETAFKLAITVDKAGLAQISRDTGISKLTLFMATLLYLHPSSTPTDIAHLLLEDTGKTYWTEILMGGDDKALSEVGIGRIGDMYQTAYQGLPSSICSSRPRSIIDYFNTSFKMWEMVVFIVWFSIPMLFEAGLPKSTLEVYAKFVLLVTKVLDRDSMTPARVDEIRHIAVAPPEAFEQVFVEDKLDKVSLVTISFHFLLHLPDNITWHGHPLLYSQFPMERRLGWLKRLVRQRTFEYRTLEKEVGRHIHFDFVQRQYPHIFPPITTSSKSVAHYLMKTRLWKGGKRGVKVDRYWGESERLVKEWISMNLRPDQSSTSPNNFNLSTRNMSRLYSSLALPNGSIIRSIRGSKKNNTSQRQGYHILVQAPGQDMVFGSVVGFIELQLPSDWLAAPPSLPSPPSSLPPTQSIYKLAFIYSYGVLENHFKTSFDPLLAQSSLAPFVETSSRTFKILPVEHIRELVGVLEIRRHRSLFGLVLLF